MNCALENHKQSNVPPINCNFERLRFSIGIGNAREHKEHEASRVETLFFFAHNNESHGQHDSAYANFRGVMRSFQAKFLLKLYNF